MPFIETKKGRKVGKITLSEDANGQPWAREWVSPDVDVVQSEEFSKLPDFVLEQLAQGFNELQLHVFQQPAHILFVSSTERVNGRCFRGQK